MIWVLPKMDLSVGEWDFLTRIQVSDPLVELGHNFLMDRLKSDTPIGF